MGHHDPLVPGMSPLATRVLAVGGDASRLGRLVANLRLRGYQAVTSSIDPAAAMAGLRQDGLRSFHVVMVDTYSHYTAQGAAFQLFEFAVHDPFICAYAVPEDGKPVGPLEMMDLDISKKPESDVTSVVQKSPQVTSNDPCNTSPATTVSTIINSPSSGGKARRNISKHIRDTDNQEVEQDREHIEKEQQPVEKAKKNRVVWTDELHNKFVEAYNKLDIKGDAVPKKILALMNDDRLTRENIASHLQKYRLNLEREGCLNSLRMSPSRTQHHGPTPQTLFPPPNMSSQHQALFTSMQSRPEKVHDDHRVNHVQTLNTIEKSNKSVLVDVSSKRMHPRADAHKQDSICGVGNSDDNILEEDISAILNNDPGPSLQDQMSLFHSE